jgi:hypothetical protein
MPFLAVNHILKQEKDSDPFAAISISAVTLDQTLGNFINSPPLT